MSVSKLLFSYLLTAIVFLTIDMVWLGVLAKNFYQKQLGFLLAEKVNWAAAIIFYLLFIAGILYFCVFPALEKEKLSLAFLNGILFGLITYATYDLTNLATLKNWPVRIVYIDIIWGMVLTSLVSTAGFLIFKWVR